MVDRLEELLALLEEEDEEERENGLEVRWAKGAARPAPEEEPEPEPEEPEAPRGRSALDLRPARTARGIDSAAEAGTAERRILPEAPDRAAADPPPAEEAAGRRKAADGAGDSLEAVRREAGSGLEELYRRTARAVSPAAPALPVEQAGRVHPSEEPGRAAALAVDELDRAVRRDSRRYDGGMCIY